MTIARFEIVARADPHALLRIVNYFAQIGLLPGSVKAHVAGDQLFVSVRQPDLGDRQARIIAEKMRGVPVIETVQLYWGRRLLLSS